jgi:hypothetical protein
MSTSHRCQCAAVIAKYCVRFVGVIARRVVAGVQ